MEDLEITTLPIVEPKAVSKFNTLGCDSDGNAAQVCLSDLVPQAIKAASIDFNLGLFFSRKPFVPGSSEVYVNGLRYTLGKDYKELSGGQKADGFELLGIESDDEIILKAIPITH
ncbi:MAG: hypothetical protein KBT45_01800 [Bacteroidales bacterium]|nr:hypothetical protein [Candidatus Colimorpha pelethequi]